MMMTATTYRSLKMMKWATRGGARTLSLMRRTLWTRQWRINLAQERLVWGGLHEVSKEVKRNPQKC